MATATSIADERLRDNEADAAYQARVNAALIALDQPTLAAAAVLGPHATRTDEIALAGYVLGVIERAGLADAFRTLLLNIAQQTQDTDLARLLGAPVTGAATATTREWVGLPSGTPRVEQRTVEAAARELARRAIGREADRQENEL